MERISISLGSETHNVRIIGFGRIISFHAIINFVKHICIYFISQVLKSDFFVTFDELGVLFMRFPVKQCVNKYVGFMK